MHPTVYPDINDLLAFLLSQMRKILGEKLVGLYLYGSLVTGDFDDEISDIDLLAATSGDIDEPQFDELQKMQDDTVRHHPKWEGRVEIAYLSLQALKTFRTHTSKMAVISPGEPFHFKEAGRDWLMNWYMVREKGITLFGPPPEAIIESISRAEFVQAVKEHAVAWRNWIDDAHSRPFQAYAILTLCRALYTCKNGEQVSKIKAALWAEKQLPEWSSLIRNAVLWRRAWRAEDVDHAATMPETQRFVNDVVDQILS
jgi:hypothetical protein